MQIIEHSKKVYKSIFFYVYFFSSVQELKHILAREEAELKRLQDVHKSKVTAYQHTKVNIQNQKKEQDTATTLR